MRDIDLFNDLGRNRKLPQIAMMEAESAGTGFFLCLRKDVRTSRAGARYRMRAPGLCVSTSLIRSAASIVFPRPTSSARSTRFSAGCWRMCCTTLA